MSCTSLFVSFVRVLTTTFFQFFCSQFETKLFMSTSIWIDSKLAGLLLFDYTADENPSESKQIQIFDDKSPRSWMQIGYSRADLMVVEDGRRVRLTWILTSRIVKFWFCPAYSQACLAITVSRKLTNITCTSIFCSALFLLWPTLCFYFSLKKNFMSFLIRQRDWIPETGIFWFLSRFFWRKYIEHVN